MPQSAVSLREERSVTDVLNATFLFIRQNIRIYGKMLGLLMTPVLGIGLILATVLGTTIDFSADVPMSDAGALSLGFTALVFVLVLFVSSLAVYTGALTIVRLYDERGPGNFDLEDVWEAGKSKILGFLGIGFLLGLIFTVPLLLVIWIPCLNLIAMAGWFLYVFGTFGLAYAAYIMEDQSVGSALSRSKELVKDYFWPTVGLYLLTTIIVTTIGSIAQMPFQVLAFSEGLFAGSQDFSGESAVFMAISYVVAILVSTFLGLIPQVAMTFQYTNLVERKENVGLQRRVEQIADDADGDAFDESPRFDPERIDTDRIDANDLEGDASGSDPYAPPSDSSSTRSSKESSTQEKTSTADDDGGSRDDTEERSASRDESDDDDTRWGPPKQRQDTAGRDNGDAKEEEATDDDRWRPPQS